MFKRLTITEASKYFNYRIRKLPAIYFRFKEDICQDALESYIVLNKKLGDKICHYPIHTAVWKYIELRLTSKQNKYARATKFYKTYYIHTLHESDIKKNDIELQYENFLYHSSESTKDVFEDERIFQLENILQRLEKIDNKKYNIIKDLFYNDKNFRTIGEELNISKQRVHQLYKKALKFIEAEFNKIKSQEIIDACS